MEQGAAAYTGERNKPNEMTLPVTKIVANQLNIYLKNQDISVRLIERAFRSDPQKKQQILNERLNFSFIRRPSGLRGMEAYR